MPAIEIRRLPPSMLDASLLAEYVKTGEAFDLSELCKKSDISIKQVAQIVIAVSLDEVDKLPGYTMTSEIFELAENLYSIGESRRHWQLMRNRHKPSYLESRLSREALKRLVVRSEATDVETLLHPRGLGDFRILVALRG